MMEYNGSIGTEQSKIRLMEQRSNSYGDKFLSLRAGYYTQQVVINKDCLHTQYFLDTTSFSGVHREKVALIPGELVLKCIEKTIPFPWTPTIESLVLTEKQTMITVFKRLLSPN